MYLMKKEAAADVPGETTVDGTNLCDGPAKLWSLMFCPEEVSALGFSLPPSMDVESG